jgi:hypothetical protein
VHVAGGALVQARVGDRHHLPFTRVQRAADEYVVGQDRSCDVVEQLARGDLLDVAHLIEGRDRR